MNPLTGCYVCNMDTDDKGVLRNVPTGGSGPSSDSDAASDLLAAPSADSSADAAADLLAEPSGSDTASGGDAFSDTDAATEGLVLGEELAASLEDIAVTPCSSPKDGYGGG